MTEKSRLQTSLKIILPVLILIFGIIAFKILIGQKQAPQRQVPKQQGVLVDILRLQPGTQQVSVQATGTVSPAREISLVPEVSGKVAWLSPRLVTGGLFKPGEVMLRIDASDYQLAVDKARSDVATAMVALQTEQERARIALQEWQRIDLPDKGQPGPLVTREIQLKQEQAKLAAANANLKLAELNLKRTELKAPFAGRIREEQVDLGQYLRAGTAIGTFAGTRRAEIQVPLPLDELRWLHIPTSGSQETGAPAIIRLPGQTATEWHGSLVRNLGEIDAQSRMATVVVAVEDPYRLKSGGKEPILHNGQFVEITLLGKSLEQVISIPRAALQSDGQVWIADPDNRLRKRPVQILRREKDQLLLESGVTPGERLILTTLSGAAEGMLLRPVELEQAR